MRIFTTFYHEFPSPIVESGRRLGWSVDTFNTHARFVSFYETKVLGQISYLRSAGSELVMFVDGSDAFVVCGPQEVEDLYKRSFAGRVVVGTDRRPWPYEWMVPTFARYSRTSSPFRYPEPGIILGPANSILGFLEAISSALPHWTEQLEGTPWHGESATPKRIILDDMGLWSLAIRDGLIDPVLDTECALSMATKSLRSWRVCWEDGRAIHPGTKTRPAIIHCNGSAAAQNKKLSMFYEAAFGECGRFKKHVTG